MNAKPNILLVDDEPRFIDSLHTILNHFDYQCSKAYSGSEALDMLSEQDFDLALLDVDLPDISGCDIARQIKESNIATTTIMLTGMNTVEIAVQAMKDGAYDFLNKPLNHELLLKTLEKAHQHNRLKKDLVVSEQRFQTLAEAAWEGIVIHAGGKIIEANEQFLSLFQYGADDIERGLTLSDIVDTAPADTSATSILQGEYGSFTVNARKKDGTALVIEIKSRTMTYHNRPRAVCAIRDISERIRAEEEKLALQKKLAATSKLNALGLMAGSIAHDLNNILAGIVSYPDLLLMQMDETSRFYPQIKKIQEAGQRAAAVVSDLVAITRGSQRPQDVHNLNDIVLEYLNSIEHGERLARYPDISVQTRLQKNIHNVYCSPANIHKLLLNLIGNGIEAVGKEGCITITTGNCLFVHPELANEGRNHGLEHVRLTIADNGPGISEKDADRIFDPFYTTKIMGKSGSGLGLSIVWNIVQQHGGWIELKNNRPGAVFEIYLPATNDPLKLEPAGKDQKFIRGAGEHILIIDDQQDQNETLEASLKSLGYNTHSVTSGERGIEYLKEHRADLILLDMMMGEGLTGRQALEIIRKTIPEQRVIIISGYAKPGEIEKTRKLGVSFILEKPITIPRLSRFINEALGRPQGCFQKQNSQDSYAEREKGICQGQG
ncbi:hybrid sensor histidine kinase/response regulator [Desulforhopalus singaporensis]|uniref:histidine kinase n=1 Tax=Desulforhopalus singaporensis TaxID=91360 RepID=A0A1H0TYV1_9BACT|nr:response regulator [Desulforhopalus singaporensis]SDP58945.1 PAS domain S-box-containing protein [Desulforhopalus singaporensis]